MHSPLDNLLKLGWWPKVSNQQDQLQRQQHLIHCNAISPIEEETLYATSDLIAHCTPPACLLRRHPCPQEPKEEGNTNVKHTISYHDPLVGVNTWFLFLVLGIGEEQDVSRTHYGQCRGDLLRNYSGYFLAGIVHARVWFVEGWHDCVWIVFTGLFVAGFQCYLPPLIWITLWVVQLHTQGARAVQRSSTSTPACVLGVPLPLASCLPLMLSRSAGQQVTQRERDDTEARGIYGGLSSDLIMLDFLALVLQYHYSGKNEFEILKSWNDLKYETPRHKSNFEVILFGRMIWGICKPESNRSNTY